MLRRKKKRIKSGKGSHKRLKKTQTSEDLHVGPIWPVLSGQVVFPEASARFGAKRRRKVFWKGQSDWSVLACCRFLESHHKRLFRSKSHLFSKAIGENPTNPAYVEIFRRLCFFRRLCEPLGVPLTGAIFMENPNWAKTENKNNNYSNWTSFSRKYRGRNQRTWGPTRRESGRWGVPEPQ